MSGDPAIDADPILRERAARLHYERRRRDALFSQHSAALGEAAWDILLDLYARPLGRRVVTTDPRDGRVTTEERYLVLLEREGLIDAESGGQTRLKRVRLSRKAEDLMRLYLLQVA